MGDGRRALDLHNEALSIFTVMDDHFEVMITLSRRANIWIGELDELEANLHRLVSIAQELNEPYYAGKAFWYLGELYDLKRGNTAQALEYYEESLQRLPTDETGLRHVARFYQALALRKAGQLEGTLKQIHDALSFFRVCGFVLGVVVVLQWLGDNAIAENDFATARKCLIEGLVTGYRDGARGFSTRYFGPLAALAASEVRHSEAVTLAAVNESLGGPALAPHNLKLIEQARAPLDEQTIAQAEDAGRSMDFNQAVSYALAVVS